MNRERALEWLVENVTKWPADILDMINPGVDWDFYNLNHDGSLDIVFAFDGENPMTFKDHITRQDWLEATDNMENEEYER